MSCSPIRLASRRVRIGLGADARSATSALVIGVAMAAGSMNAVSAASAEDVVETSGAAEDDLFASTRRELATQRAALRDVTSVVDRARLLLETGDPKGAMELVDELRTSGAAEQRVACRILMTVREYDTVGQVLSGLEPAIPEDRAIVYEWLFVSNDLPMVEAMVESVLPLRATEAVDLLAAGRLRLALLDHDGADIHYQEALETSSRPEDRRAALRGLSGVAYKRRDYDLSLQHLRDALSVPSTDPRLLNDLSRTLIRLGRTDEAIEALELAVEISPYDQRAHYMLGNGYARKNYTQLHAAYPDQFADSEGQQALAHADDLLAAGDSEGARAAYAAVHQTHPDWADVLVRLGSLEFSLGHHRDARDQFEASLSLCPEYGRAHNGIAKALQAERLAVEIHRADYEAKFAARAQPEVERIDEFIANWHALSPRHQKQVALSVEPWARYLPVLIEGGLTYYIKPLYEVLSDTPGQRTLRDLRIRYDSRLWDDVRGCGGYHTVTGVEDVEGTVLGRYNTVLHELTHQVHGVLPVESARKIQELYRQTKTRDEETGDAFLSRYAGGSVWEYFAEGANALDSPRRDDYDTREIVLERLQERDTLLEALVQRFEQDADVAACYPVAYVGRGEKELEDNRIDAAIASYRNALKLDSKEPGAISALVYALQLAGQNEEAERWAEQGVSFHPDNGVLAAARAGAQWHAGRGLEAALEVLTEARAQVLEEDRYQVDLELGRLHWVSGQPDAAIAAFDRVLEYQSDSPQGLWGRAQALALAERWDESWPVYEEAVRLRTGVVGLRVDYGRDLLRAGRPAEAREQIDAALLLDAGEPAVLALEAHWQLSVGQPDQAYETAAAVLTEHPWCSMARLVQGAAAQRLGRTEEADALLAPLLRDIESGAPPRYVFRQQWGRHEEVETHPAVERALLESLPRSR